MKLLAPTSLMIINSPSLDIADVNVVDDIFENH